MYFFTCYIELNLIGAKMKKVLFLCTANSARSQMAEALLKHYAGDQFDVYSAGTTPTEIDPRTITAMNEFGLQADELSCKSIEMLQDNDFDFVISLCDKAHKECKSWPGSGVVMAWDFPDPKTSNDPKAFIQTMQEISERIRLFILVNSKTVNSKIKTVTAIDFYKALGDVSRLQIMLLVEQLGELCVCELIEALEQPQPKVSRNLSILRVAGLLLDRRQGQWIFYRIHPLLNDWMVNTIRETRTHSMEDLKPLLKRLDEMDVRPSSGNRYL